MAQELTDELVPVPPPFHQTPRIGPDLPTSIGSGGVPGPELTRRFGFFTTVRHRRRRSSSPPSEPDYADALLDEHSLPRFDCKADVDRERRSRSAGSPGQWPHPRRTDPGGNSGHRPIRPRLAASRTCSGARVAGCCGRLETSAKSTTQGRPLLLWTSREAPRGPQGRSGSSLDPSGSFHPTRFMAPHGARSRLGSRSRPCGVGRFFYTGPLLLHPVGDGLVVTLYRTARRALTTPSHLPQDPPHVPIPLR
jgi:hypothetical protein